MITVLNASWARDNFSEVLMLAQRQPMAIARRGRVMAVLWPAGYGAQQDRERRLLDYQRRLPALERLLFHRDIAMRLLTMSDEHAAVLLRNAHPTLEAWYRTNHITKRQLLRWRWALSRPRQVLAWLIADTTLFGHLLREKSPLLLLNFPDRPAEKQAARAVSLLEEQGIEWARRDPSVYHNVRLPGALPEEPHDAADPPSRLGAELADDSEPLDGGRWRDDAAWSEGI